MRGKSDLRSPGAPISPTAQSPPVPDFITQTDKFGNAATPRSADGIAAARKSSHTHKSAHETVPFDEEQPVETLEVGDSGDSILENLRMMCCCLLSDVTYPDDTNKDVVTSPPPVASDGEKQGEEITHNNRRKRVNGTKNKISRSIVSCGRSLVDDDCEPLKLLPSIHPHDEGKKCLVLDLDETLVHSSFRAVSGADFVLPVQVSHPLILAEFFCAIFNPLLMHFVACDKIEDVVHFVYVSKRPGVDFFLNEMAKYYEVVVYTASLNKYADPLLDQLDPNGCIRARLFRDSCVYHEGNYVKDLSRLDRDLSQSIIIDNSPSSYIFHPENAIDCTSYIDDAHDRELEHIAKFLKGIRKVHDVRKVCSLWRQWPQIPHFDGILYPHDDLESSSEEEKKCDKVS